MLEVPSVSKFDLLLATIGLSKLEDSTTLKETETFEAAKHLKKDIIHYTLFL